MKYKSTNFSQLENVLQPPRKWESLPESDLNILLQASQDNLLNPHQEFLSVTGLVILSQGAPDLLQLLLDTRKL